MNKQQIYLRPNVVLEPLVDKWYVWSHLVSPATASMNIVWRHLTIIVQSNKLVELCTARGIVAERLYGEKELLYEKETSVV